jgi:hypothetical protein
VLALAAGPTPAGATSADNPYAIHSMLQVSFPYEFKREMFAEAAAAGASEIRVDVSLGALNNPFMSEQMWRGVDDYAQLSRQYAIKVLIDLNAANDTRLETCQPGVDPQSGQCGVTDLADYYEEIATLVQRVRGTIDDFEIVNEPDGQWAFTGTPQQYAGMLSTAYAAVHDNDPAGRVVLGGIMSPGDTGWLATAFTTPGFTASHKFDIANVHLRGPLAALPNALISWRKFFQFIGDGAIPVWVTETGYPSDPAYQSDPNFRGTDPQSGQAAQAAFLSKSLPALLFAGAAKVFVTERDNLTGQFASEGLLGGQVTDSDQNAPSPIEKPAYQAFAVLAHNWPPPAQPAAPAIDPPASTPPPAANAAPARPQPPAHSLGRAVRRSRGRASPSGRARASRGRRSTTRRAR